MKVADGNSSPKGFLCHNANIATMASAGDYAIIKDGAILVKGDKIQWIGKRTDVPKRLVDRETEIVDCGEGLITPGLIDCHTHLIYAGNRAHEFELKLKGLSYEEIAEKGGGIRSTVLETRRMDSEGLFQQSKRRLKALMDEGVTTLEVKSGYGLDIENELKILGVAKRLGEEFPVTISPTFLGAHFVPLEFEGRADAYVDFVCDQILPRVVESGLATAVDVFCELIAFSAPQTERIFRAAVRNGLAIKIHAEQMSDQKGAVLAARYGALSADHLEHITEEGVKAIAKSGTVAVLLPGAFYFLRSERKPPIELLRRYDVPIAISTDCNPGTSPSTSLLLMMNMACTLFDLTPLEALAGVTRNAARALGLLNEIGTLEERKYADFVVWNICEPAELAYHIGHNPCKFVIRRGSIR